MCRDYGNIRHSIYRSRLSRRVFSFQRHKGAKGTNIYAKSNASDINKDTPCAVTLHYRCTLMA